MTARNHYISNLARKVHEGYFEEKTLPVFCVSNKAYWENRNRRRKHELSMKGSGIPALRSHCHRLPARAQFRLAEHFLNVSLKGFVQQVQLWLTGGSQSSLPNDKAVQQLLERLRETLQKVRKRIRSLAGY